MAPRKKPTASANNAATSGSGSSTHWTTEETSRLIEYLIIHRAEGGDGVNFKQTTFTGAADLLLEPPDGIAKENYVVNNRDWLSCKNKWNSCKKKHAAIVDIKSQSGFSWDDESGANIGPADAARWTAFAKTRPDTKPFRNKGWKHFHEMDELMHSQLSRGTNAFHAGQETFGSQAGQATRGDNLVHEEIPDSEDVTSKDDGPVDLVHGDLDLVEQVVGVDAGREVVGVDAGHEVVGVDAGHGVAGVDAGPSRSDGGAVGRELLVVGGDRGDDDEDDIIPWEVTPPPVPVKRKFIAAPSMTPSLTPSESGTSAPSSKRQRVSGSSAALYALNDQFAEFTDVFRATSQSQTSSTVTLASGLSPQRKQAAMRRAQELEKHLDDDSMAALIEAFQMDVSAADAYMVMLDDGPRKSFVDRKIKHVNRQVL